MIVSNSIINLAVSGYPFLSRITFLQHFLVKSPLSLHPVYKENWELLHHYNRKKQSRKNVQKKVCWSSALRRGLSFAGH